MGVALGGAGLGVAEDAADDRQAEAGGGADRGVGVAEVVDAQLGQSRGRRRRLKARSTLTQWAPSRALVPRSPFRGTALHRCDMPESGLSHNPKG